MAISKKTGKKYPGALNTPIKVAKPPRYGAVAYLTPGGKEKHEALLAEYNQLNSKFIALEQIRKLPDLFRHYGVDPTDDWAELQLIQRLAYDHVPGFKVEYKGERGRGKTWDWITLAKLYYAVNDLIATHGTRNAASVKYTQATACRTLIKKEPWKSLVREKADGKNKAKVLENKYIEAKKALAGIDHQEPDIVRLFVERAFERMQKSSSK
jgi:hypothetical protein